MIQRFFFPGKWATISSCHRMEIFFYRKIVLTSFMLSNKNSTFNKLFAKMELVTTRKANFIYSKICNNLNVTIVSPAEEIWQRIKKTRKISEEQKPLISDFA